MPEEADTNKAKPSQMDGPINAGGAPAEKEAKSPKVGSPKTYRAKADGFVSADSLYVKEGEIFTTTSPKGKWMEEVTAKEAKAAQED